MSYPSVESVSQHTDTWCEQTHRSSRCRRNRNCRHPTLDHHLDHSHFGCRTSWKKFMSRRWSFATRCLLTSTVSSTLTIHRTCRLLHNSKEEVVSFSLHVTHPITCECGKSKCTRYAQVVTSICSSTFIEFAQPLFSSCHVDASRTGALRSATRNAFPVELTNTEGKPYWATQIEKLHEFQRGHTRGNIFRTRSGMHAVN